MTQIEENVSSPVQNVARLMIERGLIGNAVLSRESIFKSLLDPRRDIDSECGYPKEVDISQYRYLYEREWLAHRVVTIDPQESWAMDPTVYENKEPSKTTFETAWDELMKKFNMWHWLERADVLSGIGRFGVILLGLDDGKDMIEALEGVNEDGSWTKAARKHNLMYIRAFDEDVVDIDIRDGNPASPRFGQPIQYTIRFELEGTQTGQQTEMSVKVHWSRVIHVADNRETSEVYGVPRQKAVVNRILDCRKILSGSAEMFWKGAFPGLSLEVDPSISDAELDATATREEMERYMNGLQRYIALEGISIKSLAPQIEDPVRHMECQIQAVAMEKGIPLRIFMGSEQAKLASSQDAETWNKRVRKRQERYLSPMMIRELIDRLINVGVLPEPKTYTVEWPDLNTVTEKDKAEVLKLKVEAVAAYIKAGVDQLIPPQVFFTKVVGWDPEEVDELLKAANLYVGESLGDDIKDTNDPTGVDEIVPESARAAASQDV